MRVHWINNLLGDIQLACDAIQAVYRKRRVSARRRTHRPRSLHGFEMVEPRRLLAGIVMTPQEQLMLELVNRARLNPTGEAALWGIDLNAGLAPNTISPAPKQPLAPNQSLINAAVLHSQDMIDRDYFDHFDPSGVGPDKRLADAGYVGRGFGENIAWAGSTATIDATEYVFKNHEGLFRSTSHRQNIMKENYDELGNGIRIGLFNSGGRTYNTSMVTENFGISSNLVFITGVAFSDATQRDNFYTVGEELGGLVVTARSSSGVETQTQTGPSGGYSLPVSADTYTITFSGGNLPQAISFPGIDVQTLNRKVDLNTAQLTLLQLTMSTTSISEGGNASAVITRTGPVTSDLLVTLISSDPTAATVPSSIVLPSGVASLSFSVFGVDDTLVDGTQSVTIIASAAGATTATLPLTVLDNDFVKLRLELAVGSISEKGGSTVGTITRDGPTTNALVVSLASTDRTTAIVDSQVVIPAGSLSANFNVQAIDDLIFEGTQIVGFVASAPGVIGTNISLAIIDDETGSAWTNPRNSIDVSNDGSISAIDALLIINQLNSGKSGRITAPTDQITEYIDVSGDGFLSAIDALLVINRLNLLAASR